MYFFIYYIVYLYIYIFTCIVYLCICTFTYITYFCMLLVSHFSYTKGVFGSLAAQIYKPQIVLSKELLKSHLFSTITTVLLIKQIRISCFSYNNTCSILYTRMYNATKITHVQCNQNYIE